MDEVVLFKRHRGGGIQMGVAVNVVPEAVSDMLGRSGNDAFSGDPQELHTTVVHEHPGAKGNGRHPARLGDTLQMGPPGEGFNLCRGEKAMGQERPDRLHPGGEAEGGVFLAQAEDREKGLRRGEGGGHRPRAPRTSEKGMLLLVR